MEEALQLADILFAFGALIISGVIALAGVVKYMLAQINEQHTQTKATFSRLFTKVDEQEDELRDRVANVAHRVTRLETIDEMNNRQKDKGE